MKRPHILLLAIISLCVPALVGARPFSIEKQTIAAAGTLPEKPPFGSTTEQEFQIQETTSGAFAKEPAPRPKEVEEYRGYNGKTLLQAILSCEYEAYRIAPEQEGSPVFRKTRDKCMAREGFFPVGEKFIIPESINRYGPPAQEELMTMPPTTR